MRYIASAIPSFLAVKRSLKMEAGAFCSAWRQRWMTVKNGTYSLYYTTGKHERGADSIIFKLFLFFFFLAAETHWKKSMTDSSLKDNTRYSNSAALFAEGQLLRTVSEEFGHHWCENALKLLEPRPSKSWRCPSDVRTWGSLLFCHPRGHVTPRPSLFESLCWDIVDSYYAGSMQMGAHSPLWLRSKWRWMLGVHWHSTQPKGSHTLLLSPSLLWPTVVPLFLFVQQPRLHAKCGWGWSVSPLSAHGLFKDQPLHRAQRVPGNWYG